MVFLITVSVVQVHIGGLGFSDEKPMLLADNTVCMHTWCMLQTGVDKQGMRPIDYLLPMRSNRKDSVYISAYIL